jgi:ubiquinone/menaquinone biosynthesis C-methylase UbiE
LEAIIFMEKLEKILSKVGDLNFKRRVLKVIEYLDIKNTDKVLDAGCGEGFYTMVFNRLYGCEISSVDSDVKILEMAKKWLTNGRNLNVQQGDLCSLSYPDNFFDKVVCSEVLEHIVDDRKAVSELYRVTKNGGILAFTVPDKNYPLLWDPLNKIRESLGLGHFNDKSDIWGGIWAYDHKRLYSVSEVVKLLEDAGFLIEKTEVLTHYGFPFNCLVLVLGKRFYTKMPVAEEVKRMMEKFEWEDGQELKKSLMSDFISAVFAVFKKIDRLNNREFNLTESAMAISIKAKKPV